MVKVGILLFSFGPLRGITMDHSCRANLQVLLLTRTRTRDYFGKRFPFRVDCPSNDIAHTRRKEASRTVV
jgi:hypothetical protein